ncbi:uncharacterized protein LOC124699018 [Lolium rigidum]|uniref:uncharacterized protein LOC124699018 n=1 Tax=Lolium rigidum TaxID=89674 RepID=UPI001F5D6A12|nr:uncharacterized protein LOC124699018 [Lolium rigidum]
MEKCVDGGDDSARAVGMCDRFLTFLAKNLSINRQKNIAQGPRNDGDHKSHAEDEEDEFAVKIEKADCKFNREEEEHRSLPATILEGGSADARTSDQHKEAVAEASRKVAATEASLAAATETSSAAAPAVQGKKVRKSVTIKEEPAGDKEKAKKSLSKKRQASSVSGAGVEEPVPRPPLRWGLRPRMPSANLRVPSNINEKSSNFIEARRKGFGAGGKPEK